MGFLQQLPTAAQLSQILAPVMGDEAAGTGVVGVLKLLEQIDTANLSVSVTADLDRSFAATVSVDTGAVTGGTLAQFQQALSALPSDPGILAASLISKLAEIKHLSSTELSDQLLKGTEGLKNLQSLFPADARELIAGAADKMGQLKGEFLSGEFGEIRRWSESVQALHDEIVPLLAAGAGTPEERLLAYLREKIDGLVRLILPGGDLAVTLSHQLDAAISPDLLPRVEGLKAELIGHLNQARLEFNNGNFTNTIHLAKAHTAFENLTGVLAGIFAELRPIFDQGSIIGEGLAGVLQKQFDDFAEVEIIDLGNIKDKFAAAIKGVEDAIRGLDLNSVREKIDGVFAKIDGGIGKIDLRQFTAKLTELQGKLQSILEAIDGSLFEGVASIRNMFGQVKETLGAVTSALGTYGDDGRFRFRVQGDIEKFLNDIKTTLQNTISPMLIQLKSTVGQTLHQVQTGLDAVKGEIAKVKAQLESSLQSIYANLQSVDAQGAMESIHQRLDDMLSELGKLDFDVVVDPVVAEINEMRDELKKIDLSSLNEITIGALKVSVAVVVEIDFSAQITDALMAEFDKLLDVPKNALAELEGRVEGALKQFGELAPEALLAPLDDVFKPITLRLDALKLDALLKPLDEWHARMQEELEKVSPAALLQPMIDLYTQLQRACQSVSPAALIHPLKEAMAGIKAEIGKIDVTGIASELGGAIDQIKKSLDDLAPARLLNPMVNAFDKIMIALDKFDPGILLKPFADIFEVLAAPLANLTAEQGRVIGEVFGTLRGVVDAFDPRRIFQIVREKLAAAQLLVQQLNPGGLIASLKVPYDSMHASFEAHGGPANLSVAASVDGLNPLRSASLGQVITDFQDIQGKLNAAAQAQPPAELVARYDKVKSALGSILPIWARDDITPASIRRAFQSANPLSLKSEIDDLYDAVKQKLRTFDPKVIQEHLQSSFDKFKDAILALDPKVITGEVQAMIDALTQKMDAVNLGLITDELQGLADEINGVISGLDPQPIMAQLQGLVAEIKNSVESLRPSQALAELNAPFEASKAIVAEFNPSVFKEPLQSVFKDIQAILESIDIGIILQPLADRLKQLRSALEQALKRTETAFNGMIKAMPV